MLNSVDLADILGSSIFSFKHAAASRDDSQRFLDFAFWRDFERNGPSLYHMCETMLKGWKRYRDLSRSPSTETLRTGNREAAQRIPCRSVGYGTPVPLHQLQRERANSIAAQ
jgi:hypothetical protein